MGYIRQKDGILLPCCLQFFKYMLIPLSLYISLINPVSCKCDSAKCHNCTKTQADYIPMSHLRRNGMKDQTVIQQFQHIQSRYHMQNPFFIQHEQRKSQNAGHSGYIKKAGFMHTEKKEFGQHQSGT